MKGSDRQEDIQRRIDFLKLLYDTAVRINGLISDLRQKNLYYALAISGALFAYTFRYLEGFQLVVISIGLLLMMLAFCLMDRRYHKRIHGWRKTQRMIGRTICEVMGNPLANREVKRYFVEGEAEASKKSLQSWIYYLLVAGAVASLIYHFAL